MKQSILIICTALITICISAFSFQNSSTSRSEPVKTASCNSAALQFDFVKAATEPAPVDFFYNVAPRYNRTFTKSEIALVRSAYEFENLDNRNPKEIVSYRSVVVLTLDDNYEPIQEVSGETAEFNAEQLELLRSLPYSTDVLIRQEYLIKNPKTGEIEESYTTPHITVVPEKQAEYQTGKEAFLTYLKSNSSEQTTKVEKGKLQPGKIRFTVSKDGVIAKVKLISTSGYPSIDKTMIDLINKVPGKWQAAENAQGEKVEQELVFSFGIIGC